VNYGQGRACSPYEFKIPGDGMNVGSKIKLRKKRLSDAFNDYIWQNDPELARLDASSTLDITFSQYIGEYAAELRSSPSRYDCWFAVDTLDGKHIGNCGYYSLNGIKREAELGIMIGDRNYWDRGYGADTVNAMLSYIFNETNLERIYLKTLESNSRAQRCFRKCGFTPCGSMVRGGYNFVLMEVNRKQWKEQCKTQNQLLAER